MPLYLRTISPAPLLPMFKSNSYSLLPTSASPLASQSSNCLPCSLHTQQRLAKLTLVLLVLALFTLLYLMLGPRASPSSLLVQPSSSLLLSPSLSSDLADLSPPLSRESLGQATWAFLHTLAALYPTSPTAEEKDAALALLGALRLLYPCPKCREHWTEMWERRPAEVGSREELQRWMCDAHNEINVRLDKAVVDCDRVGEKWPSELRECGCGPEDNATSTAT